MNFETKNLVKFSPRSRKKTKIFYGYIQETEMIKKERTHLFFLFVGVKGFEPSKNFTIKALQTPTDIQIVILNLNFY